MVKTDCSQRFWSKTAIRGDCLEWQAAKDHLGYGRFLYDGKNCHAHRIAWMLTHGEYPSGVVMHSCDNRCCVKSSHLILGTQADNVKDCIIKGRRFKPDGESNSQAKLNSALVHTIRMEYQKSRCTKRSLARKYNMSDSAIGRLLNGQTWS